MSLEFVSGIGVRENATTSARRERPGRATRSTRPIPPAKARREYTRLKTRLSKPPKRSPRFICPPARSVGYRSAGIRFQEGDTSTSAAHLLRFRICLGFVFSGATDLPPASPNCSPIPPAPFQIERKIQGSPKCCYISEYRKGFICSDLYTYPCPIKAAQGCLPSSGQTTALNLLRRPLESVPKVYEGTQ